MYWFLFKGDMFSVSLGIYELYSSSSSTNSSKFTNNSPPSIKISGTFYRSLK